MRNTSRGGMTAAVLVLIALGVLSVFGQGVKKAHLVPVPHGSKQKLQGVIATRENDTFKMRDPSGAETVVVLTSRTKVSTHNKITGRDTYPETFLMRGLRVQVQGVGDANRQSGC